MSWTAEQKALTPMLRHVSPFSGDTTSISVTYQVIWLCIVGPNLSRHVGQFKAMYLLINTVPLEKR